MPLDFSGIPSSTDVPASRCWVNDVFVGEKVQSHRAKFEIQRRRPKQEVKKSVVRIPSSDSSKGGFELWIYEAPSDKTEAPRPAIFMLHGGGWVHGDPLSDERKFIKFELSGQD